jgi:hypothetical protein
MAARNDITGDAIQTKSVSASYRDNYDLIWGKKKVDHVDDAINAYNDERLVSKFDKEQNMTPRVQENVEEVGKCGCGRSPTGKCIGWHGLSEEEFRDAKAVYEDKVNKENQ